MGLTDYLKKKVEEIGKKIEEEVNNADKKIEEELKSLNKTLDGLKILRGEEKQKMEQLGLEAYISNMKEHKEVYGEVSEEHMNRLQKFRADAKEAGDGHFVKSLVEGYACGLGVNYRRKMKKETDDKTMEEK